MVDPTDPATPADTDFVKGAAAELRALKSYIKNHIKNSPLFVRGKFGTSVGAPSVLFVSNSGLFTAAFTRTSVGSYKLVLTGVNFNVDGSGNILCCPIINFNSFNTYSADSVADPGILSYTITQDTTAHTVTISFSIVSRFFVYVNDTAGGGFSHDVFTSQIWDPHGNEQIDVTVTGDISYPTF